MIVDTLHPELLSTHKHLILNLCATYVLHTQKLHAPAAGLVMTEDVASRQMQRTQVEVLQQVKQVCVTFLITRDTLNNIIVLLI